MGVPNPPAAENSTSSATATSASHEIPPAYHDNDDAAVAASSDALPSYQSAQRAFAALAQGDPDETITIPMVTRTQAKSIHNYNPFSRKQGTVRQSVTTRQMKRSTYLAHYAKDIDGNYIGTGAPAPDAPLVFVPGKSSDADMLKQAEEVALKVQRLRGDGIGDWGKPMTENLTGYVPAGGFS